MSDKSQRRTSDTGHPHEGLILSPFQVLQENRTQQEDVRQHMKLNCSFLGESEVTGTDRNQAEGDEMFDVNDVDQFRADEVADSLDNTTSNSLDREDDGDDEEEDDDEDDEEDRMALKRARLQRLSSRKTSGSVEASVSKLACGPSVSDLRAHHCPPDGFEDLTPTMGAHGYLEPVRSWHVETTTPANSSRFQPEWHMSLNSASGVTARNVLGAGDLSGPPSPGEIRGRDGGDQQWKFVHNHGQTSSQHLWGPEPQAVKMMVDGPAGQGWVSHKQDLVEDHPHDVQGLHRHSVLDLSSHWSQRIRSAAPQGNGWHKDIGGVITPEEDMNAVRSLFNLQAAQPGVTSPSVNGSYSDLACSNTASWKLGSHLPSTSAMTALPQGVLHHELPCRRASPSAFYHTGPVQGYAGYPGQGRDSWQAAALSPTVDDVSNHIRMTEVPPSLVCKSAMLNKRNKARSAKCRLNIPDNDIPLKARSVLDQARQQAHPYQMKEQKKIVRDVYPAMSGNVHTLKASHIVSWYIDYLIHENEHLTQISRAFSLPVNLFLSDDFYFMDSLKKKVHFPSLKFLSWMQQNLPSINVNAIDFHEGRPPVVSSWNQDWFWQNKSRRDIIHDVFFYFQHRRVTCEN